MGLYYLKIIGINKISMRIPLLYHNNMVQNSAKEAPTEADNAKHKTHYKTFIITTTIYLITQNNNSNHNSHDKIKTLIIECFISLLYRRCCIHTRLKLEYMSNHIHTFFAMCISKKPQRSII